MRITLQICKTFSRAALTSGDREVAAAIAPTPDEAVTLLVRQALLQKESRLALFAGLIFFAGFTLGLLF